MTAAVRFRRTRGLSLIEMIIALAILAMLATLALGGLRLGVRTWETVGQRVETESRTRIVRGFLRRALSQTTAVLERVDRRELRPLFAGERDSLILLAPLADHLGLGGLQRLELTVEDQGGGAGRRLVLVRTPYDSSPGDQTGASLDDDPERHVLLEGVSEIHFEYQRDSGDGNREWTDRWTDEPKLPAALRLVVETPESRPPWPDLVVPLQITAMTGRL